MPAVVFVSGQPAARVHASLRQSLAAMDEARRCAVLWFADAMKRRLYRELGYASINQYAMQGLGFSRTRTGDFVRLVRQLDALPAVRAAVASGALGYTKAREVVKVATAETEDRWLAAAQGTRKELQTAVKRAKRAAAVDPGQGELLPAPAPVVAPHELPVRHEITLTPEQEARRAALVERLHKLGGVPGDRAELLLEALAALVEVKESRRAPRGAPPVQIHVHETDGRMTVETDAGTRELSRAEAERMRCDAAVTACPAGATRRRSRRERVVRSWLAISTVARRRGAAARDSWRSITSNRGDRAARTQRTTSPPSAAPVIACGTSGGDIGPSTGSDATRLP